MSLFFLSLGLTWSNYSFKQHSEQVFPSNFESVDFSVLGQVEGLPSAKNGDIKFYFRVKKLDSELPQSLMGMRFSLSCYRCPLTIETQDIWQLTLRVKRPHGYASWGAFDYEKYLFRNRVHAKGYIRLKGINTLVSKKTSSLQTWRQELRQSLRDAMQDGIAKCFKKRARVT